MFLSKKTRKEWYTLWWCAGVWVHPHDSKTIRNVREEIRYKKKDVYINWESWVQDINMRYIQSQNIKHVTYTKKDIQIGDRNIQSWMRRLRWRRRYSQVMVDLRDHGGVLVEDSCMLSLTSWRGCPPCPCHGINTEIKLKNTKNRASQG